MINLSEEQSNAVDLCCDFSHLIASVTGAAGTGKTSVLANVYERLVEEIRIKYSMEREAALEAVKLAAPTGRAAKRIEEATGISAVTIHRMLRFSVPSDDKDHGLPAHNKFNLMPYYAILIDEASMVPVDLRRAVIDAMRRGAVVRFFGDINQLPPVPKEGEKPFSPFAQDLQKFPSITLTKNFRSTDGIIDLADRVIKNKMPLENSQVKIHKISGINAKSLIMNIAERIDFTSDRNQIICPTKNTTYGTNEINRAIQQKFNPQKEKITLFKKGEDDKTIATSFKRGDKLLWTKNDYNLNLINGTLGTVLDFDLESGDIFITADGRDIAIPARMKTFNATTGEEYSYDPRQQMDLGYAISTHKSQGSQFDNVLFVLSRSRAASRQNVYTAITRAKFKIEIINIANAMSAALDNLVNIYAKN